MNVSPDRLVSRRRFLAMTAVIGAGTVGAGTLLAACGGDGTGEGRYDPEDLSVMQRFSSTGLVPGDVRLPVSLASKSQILDDAATAAYATLTARVVSVDSGDTVVESLSAEKHGEGLTLPYWPFVARIEKPGTYALIIDGASKDGAAFQVLDPSSVPMPVVGGKLPPFDTPTTDDPRGVDPICTLATGTCPFHSVTLTEALASGKPVVYLIGTPAFCKTGTCAPALEGLGKVAESVGDAAVFVHADVYADKSATTLAPAVTAYKMSFEPVLFVADAQGVIRNRLDGVFDRAEIAEVLASAGIS
jgi:hypothetical protein